VVLGDLDVVTGHRVGSSWNDDWMAYDSSREALLAAMHRLTEINAVFPGGT